MIFFFDALQTINHYYWSYVGWIIITLTGIYITIHSRGLQFKALFHFRSNIKQIYAIARDSQADGIHPFKLYFASVGGTVGLGNIVYISVAIMIGGPGSIFWMILASLSGMLLKYAEIYLGVKYRVKNEQGGFNGGPMYFLQRAFTSKKVAYVFACLLCFYGVEISNFLIIVDRIEYSFDWNRNVIIIVFLAIILYSSLGGIKRLANICSSIMPFFMGIYVLIACYIIGANATYIPSFFKTVCISAFQGHAPLGGFMGSSMILAAYMGVSKTVYSGDIGLGYDAIMQSETCIANPKIQAILAIYALFTDTIICILTNTMLGLTGSWYTLNELAPSDIVAQLLSQYIPYSGFFMTCLLFFAGYTTIIAYLSVGTKCAEFISPKYGKLIYLIYAVFAFIYFCSFSQNKVIVIMELLSGMLVLLNLAGILKLRKEIDFN